MSYILDALKKSEQERGHGNIPDVQTVHSSSLNYRNEKRTYWPYILIAVVLLNLLAIIYFIVNKENTPVIEAAAPPSTVTADTTKESSIAIVETQAPKSSAEAVINDNSATEIEKVIVKHASTNVEKIIQQPNKTETSDADTGRQTIREQTGVIDFYELPESLKQELPAFIISAHVYSTNPAQRSIVINNNFMEEGEYVLDGLILYEITPDGAVFNYQGTLFSYGVVSGWQ